MTKLEPLIFISLTAQVLPLAFIGIILVIKWHTPTKMDKDNIQNRRQFFKNAAKSMLPILGCILIPQSLHAWTEPSTMTPSGCGGSCTGLCTTSCTSQCQNSCDSSCTGSCSNGCQSGCQGGCTQQCRNNCSRQCAGGCGGNCSGSCRAVCARDCVAGCSNDCITGCKSGCSSSCSYSCTTGCRNICGSECSHGCRNSCRGYCSGMCSVSCTGTAALFWCKIWQKKVQMLGSPAWQRTSRSLLQRTANWLANIATLWERTQKSECPGR